MKNEENKFLNEKIDQLAKWMKKSMDFDLDPKALENLKKIAGRSSMALETLMAKVFASVGNKQVVEKGVDFQSLFVRLRKFLPRITEADAQKIFQALKQLVAKEIERRKNRKQ